MCYASNAYMCTRTVYISAETGTLALMKDYLHVWSTSGGKANCSIHGRQRHWQGTKTESGKIANCSYSYSCKKVYSMTAQSRY